MRKLIARNFATALVVPLLIPAIAWLPRPAQAQNREINSSLAGQLRMVQLRVTSGRIAVVGPASQQNVTANHTSGQQRERLSIDLAGGLPTISYERATRAERLSFEVVRGQQLSIHVIPHSPSEQASIEFSQPAEGPLSLTISSPGRTQSCSGPSLWHLLILEPGACREHLLPLLEMVRPHWDLDQQAREIETALCRRDAGQNSLNRTHWQRSVTALASDRFADREQAERELRQAGPVVLSFLRAVADQPGCGASFSRSPHLAWAGRRGGRGHAGARGRVAGRGRAHLAQAARARQPAGAARRVRSPGPAARHADRIQCRWIAGGTRSADHTAAREIRRGPREMTQDVRCGEDKFVRCPASSRRQAAAKVPARPAALLLTCSPAP